MAHLVNHATHRRRVLELHRVPDAPQPQAFHHRELVSVESDRTPAQADLHRARAFRIGSLIGHGLFLLCAFLLSLRHGVVHARSDNSLPRIRASVAGSFSDPRPVNVARTTLCGFADPSDFVRIFVIPAASTTARTAPPAMMPVPSDAGFSSTLPAPKFPTIVCGMVVPCSGTRIRFFFAASIAFLMADGTSFALPMPKPTTPRPSPTTTRALKLRFLPPLTTFVTRLIETTVSLMSSCDGSILSRVRMLMSPRS